MKHERDECNLVTTQEWSVESIDRVLSDAADIKANPERYWDVLKRKSLCMYFFNPSLRTRNSFEVGINQMGGHGVFIDSKTSWLGQESESIKDTAAVLSRYFDLLAVRMFPNIVDWQWGKCNEQLRDFAKWSRVPVINMEDDLYHPCQALTDAFTIHEDTGGIAGKKIAISWAYHPKPLPMAVPNSILLLATRLGMNVTFARPDGHFDLDESIMNTAKENARVSNGTLEIDNDMKHACEGADIVYVKSWGSKDFYGDARAEKKVRQPHKGDGTAWMMTPDKMAVANPDARFMHCLPVRRNVVVSDDVIDGKWSIVYDQAENRMHVQKAIMSFLIKQSNSGNVMPREN